MLVGSSFAVLNFFYFQLLNPNASLQDISSVLSILSSCVCHFPGPTGPFRVSNFLWLDLQTRVMNDNKKIGTLQPMDPPPRP